MIDYTNLDVKEFRSLSLHILYKEELPYRDRNITAKAGLLDEIDIHLNGNFIGSLFKGNGFRGHPNDSDVFKPYYLIISFRPHFSSEAKWYRNAYCGAQTLPKINSIVDMGVASYREYLAWAGA